MVKIESPMFTSDNDLKSPETRVTYSVPLKQAAVAPLLEEVAEVVVPPAKVCVVADKTVTT